MMSSIEGLAPNTAALGADMSGLKDSYRRLLRAIDRGELEMARHLMTVIDAEQSRRPGLSDGAQEAFDRLAVAATTEDLGRVREALRAFRGVLRSNGAQPSSRVDFEPEERPEHERVEDSRPSGVTPRARILDFSVEAFDQELPETASLFAVENWR